MAPSVGRKSPRRSVSCTLHPYDLGKVLTPVPPGRHGFLRVRQ